ncbi:unnamed protein product, partial [marine sediment metagenome]
MNTKNLAQNKYVALSLYIIVMIGLVGCGTLEVGAVEAKAMGANPIEAEAVKIMNNEIQMEQENGSADLISMDQLPSDA